MRSPYRTPADTAEIIECPPLPWATLGRILGGFGLWKRPFVRRSLGGRWEKWSVSVPGSPSLWTRVNGWTDRNEGDPEWLFSTIWISKHDWSIIEREEWL